MEGVQEFVVDGQPALWVTFEEEADFPFVLLVIAPDCGDGQHTLFTYTSGSDPEDFAFFLGRLHFMYETIDPSERATPYR